MSDLDEVLTRLPRLTSAELDTVKQRIKVCLSIPTATSANVEPQDDDDSMMVLHAITQVLIGTGKHTTILYKRLANEVFRLKATILLNFIRHQTTNHNEQRALLKLGIELLYRDVLSWSKRPVGVRSLMFFIDQVVPVFDIHFPGYAESGLLAMVIRVRHA